MTHHRYSQSTGRWVLVKDDGTEQFIGQGFAGNDYRPDTNPQGLKGLNAPDMDNVKCVGPLPRGWYTIGKPVTHKTLGPVCMFLQPDAANDMHGRSAFYIHGWATNPAKKWQSSEGCICLPNIARVAISASGFTRLEVVR